MTIIRTPRPAEPDTRRAATGGGVTRGRKIGVGLTRSHILELQARARRANLVVSTREEPRRPQPRQRVYGPHGRVTVHRSSGENRRSAVTDVGLELMPTTAAWAELRVVCSW